MEYMKNGVFIPVLKEAVKNCRLVLIKEEEAVWKYFQNWSIARMSEDGFTSLKLEDRIWDKSRLSLHLEATGFLPQTAFLMAIFLRTSMILFWRMGRKRQ